MPAERGDGADRATPRDWPYLPGRILSRRLDLSLADARIAGLRRSRTSRFGRRGRRPSHAASDSRDGNRAGRAAQPVPPQEPRTARQGCRALPPEERQWGRVPPRAREPRWRGNAPPRGDATLGVSPPLPRASHVAAALTRLTWGDSPPIGQCCRGYCRTLHWLNLPAPGHVRASSRA